MGNSRKFMPTVAMNAPGALQHWQSMSKAGWEKKIRSLSVMQNVLKLRKCGHITFRMQQKDRVAKLSQPCQCLMPLKLMTNSMRVQRVARLDTQWSRAVMVPALTNGRTGPRSCTTRQRHTELILSGGVVAQTVAPLTWRCIGAKSKVLRSSFTPRARGSPHGWMELALI